MKPSLLRRPNQWISLVLSLLFIVLLLPSSLEAASQRIVLPEADSSAENSNQAIVSLSTLDGGQLTVSTVLSGGSGGKDIALTKTDKDGKVSWTKTYGGSGDEEARSIQQTTDGGFILTGYTSSQGAGGRDLYMLRLNKWGDQQWDAAVGGSADDEGIMVQQTGTGFVAVGYTTVLRTATGTATETKDADILAVCYDKNGKKLWQKNYGGSEDDYACSIQTLKNGGFVIAGCSRSFSNGTWDIYVIKISDSGMVNWEKSIGGNANYISSGIQQTPDNGYLVMAYTFNKSSAQRSEARIRLDSSGAFLWQQILSDQSLYGDAMQSALTPAQETLDSGTSNDNALPPPEIPQAKQSRKSISK
jgi:hypothetical protein